MRDQDEFWLVQQRIGELLERPISGNFDVAHLKETHRYIFQDLPKAGLWNYDVPPGAFRKETPTWCKERVLASIEGEAKRLSASLAAERHLHGLDKPRFVERPARYYAEWNVLHPFREGNGRGTREFIGHHEQG
jgi:cell filamentation protein